MATCPVCSGSRVSGLLALENMPVLANQLHREQHMAKNCGRADITLELCQTCGHIFNSAFSHAKVNYSTEYVNPLNCSEHFRMFQTELTNELIDQHKIKRCSILEIGCGNDADFLLEICEKSQSRGYGFDEACESGGTGLVKLFSHVRYGESPEPPDFIICRHVLEHIEHSHSFILALRNQLTAWGKDGVIIYFEVPNSVVVLPQGDIPYEHVQYFSQVSLRKLFESCGFEVLRLKHYYRDQVIGLEAKFRLHPQRKGEGISESLLAEVKRSATRFSDEFRLLKTGLESFCQRDGLTAFWGAGSRGVVLLNQVDPDASMIGCIVDINWKKQGCFIAGSGHPIVDAEALKHRNINRVIVLNPVYRSEIQSMLNCIDFKGSLLTLGDVKQLSQS